MYSSVATFPALAKSGTLYVSNQSVTTLGSSFVNSSPTSPSSSAAILWHPGLCSSSTVLPSAFRMTPLRPKSSFEPFQWSRTSCRHLFRWCSMWKSQR